MNRKMLVSLGIIAVLLLVLLVSKMHRSSDVPVLEPWDKTANEIIIRKSGSVTRLYLDGGKWRIGEKGYTVDSGVVAEMEKKLKEISVTDLISELPHYNRYDLDAEKGVTVTVKSGSDVLRDLTIGKTSSTHRQTYIRLDGRPEIFLASGNLSGDFNKSIDEMRDKEILRLRKEDVSSFSFTGKGMQYTLERVPMEKEASPSGEPVKKAGAKDDGSKAADGKPVPKKPHEAKKADRWVAAGHGALAIDSAKVDQLLSSFDPLKAMSFPDIEPKALSGRECTVKIVAGGKTIELAIYKKLEEGRYPCISSESPYVFTIDAWKAERLMKKLDDYREPAEK